MWQAWSRVVKGVHRDSELQGRRRQAYGDLTMISISTVYLLRVFRSWSELALRYHFEISCINSRSYYDTNQRNNLKSECS
jgi:hypothetical protein